MTKTLLLTSAIFASFTAFAEPLSSSPASMPDTTSELTRKISVATLTRSEIKDAQKALNDETDAQLTVDGRVGARTTEALRKFQDDHGLTVTGTFTNETIDELGVDIQDRAPASIEQQQAVPVTPEEASPVK